MLHAGVGVVAVVVDEAGVALGAAGILFTICMINPWCPIGRKFWCREVGN